MIVTVKPEQVRGAVAALSILSHVGGSKLIEVDISSSPASVRRHLLQMNRVSIPDKELIKQVLGSP